LTDKVKHNVRMADFFQNWSSHGAMNYFLTLL